MRTYLTKQVGDLTIVYHIRPGQGECHVAYYNEKGEWYVFN
jgi:hypothetical protein